MQKIRDCSFLQSLFNVGVTRFELAASASLTRRSSQTEPHPDIKSCRAESNRRPPHYQCDALPTEPRQQLYPTILGYRKQIIPNRKLCVKNFFLKFVFDEKRFTYFFYVKFL